jgi:ubiquinone/menaquinone biosynthesis C-methylase UbiE
MAAFTLQSMPGLLDHVEAGSIGHLLDVGGGDGTTAVALARRDPALRITIFDMPSVTGLAQRGLPDDLADRVGLHPGDLFADSFPAGVDAVLFSHVLEVFSPDRIRFLLDKAFRVLPPGGRLLLYGFHAAAGETGGVLAARLSLYLNVLATGEGMAYPARDYEQWLRDVGATKVESFTGLPYEHGLIVGRK